MVVKVVVRVVEVKVLEVKVLAVTGPDGGYPGGDAGGEMMQKQKIRPFNSMGGYYSPQRFNSFSARPTPNPNFRR